MRNFVFFNFSALRSKNTQSYSRIYTSLDFFSQVLKNKQILVSDVEGLTL